MTIDISALFWTLINIFSVIFIVYILYTAYKNVKNKAENQRKQNEVIVKKLEEITEENKKIREILSEKNPKVR